MPLCFVAPSGENAYDLWVESGPGGPKTVRRLDLQVRKSAKVPRWRDAAYDAQAEQRSIKEAALGNGGFFLLWTWRQKMDAQ
jgi:hypothetical protein